MKKILISFVALLLIAADAEAQKSCCQKPSGMQALALNTDFIDAHLPPLPLDYTPARGSMITFPVQGGKDGNAFYVPSDGPSMRVLLVFHEWWGVNDYIKKEAENWQSKLGDIDVYAVDLFDGQVAATPEDASQLTSGLDVKRAEAIIKGILQKIGNKKIAIIGWCFGGGWSFAATVLAGNNAVGCVMYYGFPEKDLKKVKPLKADVLYIYGAQDKFIKKTDVDAFGKRITNLGYQFQYNSYNADHAFANPSNPKYNKIAAGEANAIALKFLQQHLGM